MEQDISFYFSPIVAETIASSDSVLSNMQINNGSYFPELNKNSIALIFCDEQRNSDVEEYSSNSNKHFEKLVEALENFFPTQNWKTEIAVLGEIKPGNTKNDTFYALGQVCSILIKNEIIPIVIGNSIQLNLALYKSYHYLEQLVNVAFIDKKFRINDLEAPLNNNNYVSKFLLESPCYLFNVSVVGIQQLFNPKKEWDLIESLYFDTCRLSEYNSNFKTAEPLIRNADLFSFNLESLKFASYQSANNTPNGFDLEQACQLSKYAGISDKLNLFSVMNFNSKASNNEINAVAEMVWYFIDGVNARKKDFPIGPKKEYTKFIVQLEEQEINFYKSPKSDRWWMEVPYPQEKGQSFVRHHLVPCNYEDYQMAMKNEMPDLWWKTYQKLF